MRVLLFGPGGVLGTTLTRIGVLRGHVVIPVTRSMCNYMNLEQLKECIKKSEADIIINCAGLTQITADLIDVISINGLFPHLLLRALSETGAGSGLIHISSADVFSGRLRNRYTIQDLPDPRDYMGRSKSLGEIIGPNVCTVRTSIYALEAGFMKFLFNNRGRRIEAWDNVLTTGSTVDDVSEALLWLADRMLEGVGYSGLIHLATDQSISKYSLALMISDLFRLDLDVRPVYEPVINRSLKPTIILRSIGEALSDYARNNVPNEEKASLRAAVDPVAG